MSDVMTQVDIVGDWRLVVLVMGGILIILTVSLMRAGKLKEGYALPWFGLGIFLLMTAGFPSLLSLTAELFNISSYLVALLLVVVAGLVFMAIMHAVWASRHDRLICDLAQEHAILEAYLRRQLRHYGND